MKLLKNYLLILLALVMTLSMSACSIKEQNRAVYSNSEVDNANDALQLLKNGNKRFVEEKMENYDLGDTKRQELTEGQKPFAVVVTCSDSRVVPEYIFDQGLGDIFVIRVAGNVLDTDQIASIEYGVEHCGANLVVFLGHQSCGAVTAAVEAHEAHSEEVDSKNKSINELLNKIEPSVEAAEESGAVGDDLVEKAIDLNVEAGVQQLKEESQIISEGIESGEVQVIGAKYLLDSGEVTWFE